MGRRSAAQRRPRCVSQARAKPSRPCSATSSRNRPLIVLRGCRAEREGEGTKPEFEEAIAAPRLAVIVALGRRPRDDLDLSVVEAEAAIDREDLRFDRPLIGKKDPRRAALDDRRRDRARFDIGKRLRGEDDGGVFLAQRFEPFAQLRGKSRIVEREPAFVDDEQSGRAVERRFDPVKEIGENGRRGGGADQPFRLEALDFGVASDPQLRRRAADHAVRRGNRV